MMHYIRTPREQMLEQAVKIAADSFDTLDMPQSAQAMRDTLAFDCYGDEVVTLEQNQLRLAAALGVPPEKLVKVAEAHAAAIDPYDNAAPGQEGSVAG